IVVVGMPVVHVVEALRFSTDPERGLTVDEQRVRTYGAAVEPGNDEGGPLAVRVVLHAEPWSDAVEAGPHRSRWIDGDVDGAVARSRIRQLFFEVGRECACREAAHHRAREPQRSVGLRRDAERKRRRETVLAAVAEQALALDAAQRSHAVADVVPRHPNRSGAIFGNGPDAGTSRRRRVVEEVTVLESTQTAGRANPEGAVTCAEQRAEAE